MAEPSRTVQQSVPGARETPSREQLRRLVGYAILAPSGGNIQAWRFEAQADGRLRCFYDAARADNFLDFQYSASYLALGAAVENIAIAAASLGFGTEVELLAPDGSERVCDLRFAKSAEASAQASLAGEIERRCTNRRLAKNDRPLSHDAVERLREAARTRGASLQLASGADALREIGRVVGVCDRLRLSSELMHRELMAEVRWTPDEARSTGDGVDVQTLEVNRAQIWLLRQLSNYRNVQRLMRFGVQKPFEQMGAESVQKAAAVGLITVKGTSSGDYFQGGRALERVWLTTSALDLGFQPLAVVPYMFARLLRGTGYTAHEERALRAERARLGAVMELRDDAAEVMMFRLSHVPRPSARAQRRPLDLVFTNDVS
jgi:hypothetical protein